MEVELVNDVAATCAAVAHVNLVQHVVAEFVEVRAALRILERDEAVGLSRESFVGRPQSDCRSSNGAGMRC